MTYYYVGPIDLTKSAGDPTIRRSGPFGSGTYFFLDEKTALEMAKTIRAKDGYCIVRCTSAATKVKNVGTATDTAWVGEGYQGCRGHDGKRELVAFAGGNFDIAEIKLYPSATAQGYWQWAKGFPPGCKFTVFLSSSVCNEKFN